MVIVGAFTPKPWGMDDTNKSHEIFGAFIYPWSFHIIENEEIENWFAKCHEF